VKRVIAHLSDLHFGRIDPPTLDPLAAEIAELKPDLIAVSGDLTQRARPQEFEQARIFLDRLPGPRIVVPGNHDVPLHNPYLRFISKWQRFREHIHTDLDQSFTDEELAVAGINTARALTWKSGRIGLGQIENVRRFFAASNAGALRVLVAHHPLDLPQVWHGSDQARRAGSALERWGKCGVDLILAGHAHRAWAGGGAETLRLANHRAVVVQAGTATSTRGRGEPNSFNVIEVGREEIIVVRKTWQPDRRRFAQTHEDRFARESPDRSDIGCL
jgi:3',5'-cyclic AMP phosphodiesterase CpdA